MAGPSPCTNPRALGTSRTMVVGPAEQPLIGTMQYTRTLPLKEREVVLTFDDGPVAPYTSEILDTLARECVKATFFVIGNQANAAPELVRRIYSEGHSIGTHSQNHPLTFDQMSQARVAREVNDGIASATEALGDRKALSPFFRIPGLLRSKPVEDYLASQSLAVWSTDVVADDWYKHATAQDIVRKAINRLEEKRRGVLLLHDVHPATVMALPALLKELKARGYRIVHAVAPGQRPGLQDRVAKPGADRQGWPRTTRDHERNTRERLNTGAPRRPAQAAERRGWTLFQR